jgi:hypothetical protein
MAFTDWFARTMPSLASAIVMVAVIHLARGPVANLSASIQLALLCPLGAAIYIAALAIADMGTLKGLFQITRGLLYSNAPSNNQLSNGSDAT